MPQPYKYFAFISYSRKDGKAAAWLQKRLEWFRFPVRLVPEGQRPPDPSYVRPIYRDKTNLQVTDEHYWKNIRLALEQSRFLIVLASPNSAQSKNVEIEVSHFLATHGQHSKFVVPVVLNGSITDTGSQAALGPTLRDLGETITSRNLPSMVPDEDSDQQGAWEQGFVSLASYLLSLDRGAIGDHIQRETKRQTTMLRRWLAAVVVLAVVALVGGVVAYNQKQAADLQTRRAINAEKATQSQLVETNRQLERSQVEEGRSWLERARAAAERKEPLTAEIYAARAVGFRGYGWQPEDETKWKDDFPPLLSAIVTDDVKLEESRKTELEGVKELMDKLGWRVRLRWSSPLSSHHSFGVSCVAFSPDGRLLASGSWDGYVRLWDVASGAAVAKLGGKEWINALAFSPDGTLIATATNGNTANVWNVAEGRVQSILKGHDGPLTSIAFAPDGKSLATGSEDKTVRLWEPSTGRHLTTLLGHEKKVTCVIFHPDGKRLASKSDDHSIKFWSVASGEMLQTLGEGFSLMNCIAFSPNGDRMAVGEGWGTAIVYDVTRGTSIGTFKAEKGVESIAFSPDGKTLAAGTGEFDGTGEIVLWDVRSGQQQAAFRNQGGSVPCIAFSPDGTRLAGASRGQRVMMCDVPGKRLLSDGAGHFQKVTSTAFSPDGTLLASGSADSTVKLWDLTTGKEHHSFEGHEDEVNSVVFSPDGTLLASGSKDKTVRIWDVATKQVKATFSGHSGNVARVLFSPDGTRLASGTATGSETSEIFVWEVATGKKLASLSPTKSTVKTMAFSKDGARLTAKFMYGPVKMWEISSGRALTDPAQTTESDIGDAVLNPDGTRIAYGTSIHPDIGGASTYQIIVQEVATGKVLAKLPGHTGFAESLAFSPDLDSLASGSKDGSIKLWSIANQRMVASYDGHFGEVGALAFNADGTRLASAGGDASVRVWDLGVGDLRTVGAAEPIGISEAAFSPDATLVASSSGVGMIQMWDFETGLPLVLIGAQSLGEITFGSDGRQLFSSNINHGVSSWDVASARMRNPYEGLPGTPNAVAVSADGTRLAAASLVNGITLENEKRVNADGTRPTTSQIIKIWDAATRQELGSYPFELGAQATLATSGITALCFSPDRSRLAYGPEDRKIRILDPATGKVTAVLEGHHDKVTALAFSPDGARLASASWDHTARLWDARTGTLLQTLDGHREALYSIAFSPDGALVVTGSSDGSARLWDAASGREINRCSTPGAKVLRAAFSSHGTACRVAGIKDSEKKLWFRTFPVRPAEELDLMLPQRHGFFKLEGRELQWSTCPNLYQSREFPSDFTPADDLTALAEQNLTSEARALLRLRLLSRLGQWRAAMALWPTFENPGKEGRRVYLSLLLAKARQMILDGTPGELADILPEVTRQVSTENWEDPRISLPLVSLLGPIPPTDDPTVEKIVDDMVQHAIETAPVECLESVLVTWSGRVALKQHPKMLPIFVRWNRQAVARFPQNVQLVRCLLVALPFEDPDWLRYTELVLGRQDVLPGDFANAALKAAEQPEGKGAAVAVDIVRRSLARFPNDATVIVGSGWSLLRLGSPEEALPFFRAAARLLEPDKQKSNIDFLIGKVIALWQTNDVEGAVESYVQLLGSVSALKRPETIQGTQLAEHHKQALLQTLNETLRRHPELEPPK